MRLMCEDDGTEAILLVDTRNAFNSLIHQAALRYIHILYTILAPVLINTYRSEAKLFIGGEHILSQEGTIQGGPPCYVSVCNSHTPNDLQNQGGSDTIMVC